MTVQVASPYDMPGTGAGGVAGWDYAGAVVADQQHAMQYAQQDQQSLSFSGMAGGSFGGEQQLYHQNGAVGQQQWPQAGIDGGSFGYRGDDMKEVEL